MRAALGWRRPAEGSTTGEEKFLRPAPLILFRGRFSTAFHPGMLILFDGYILAWGASEISKVGHGLKSNAFRV